MKLKISALITTFNSSATIEKALKSVEWCDEILVVDSFSTDSTLEIARKSAVRIIQREYQGSSRQLEYGTSIAEHEYVLILDSDEEISDNLKNEITEILKSGNFNEGGYRIPRKVYFLGKWIEHGGWNNDYQYRLTKKTNTKFIHAHDAHWATECKYPVLSLNSLIYHYSYRNIFDHIGRLNIYSSLDVRTKLNKKKELNIKWYNFIVNPILEFVKMFFFKKGFKDGIQGFILAILSATHKLSAYMKMWEYEYCRKNGLELPPVTYADFREHKKN